ncbi:MAG: hypothetical protein KF905_16695 [Flavobacteriales bacterium]|nr:hypothetical protein [Flavobacteriales bacterium]
MLRIDDKWVLKASISDLLADPTRIGEDAVALINLLGFSKELYLVGGAIRDVHSGSSPRDLDFILSDPFPEDCLHMAERIGPYSKNRLGGLKFKLSTIEVDLWSLSQNWANRERVVRTKNALTKEIAKGNFLNYDGLVFAAKSNILECSYFNKCIDSSELDIIRHSHKYAYSNPNRLANVLRAFYLSRKHRFSFSDYLTEYISRQLHSFHLERDDTLAYLLSGVEKYPKYADLLTRLVLEEYIQAFTKSRPHDEVSLLWT